jgi:predicted SPOUT superfamily RNA methylase MTH1
MSVVSESLDRSISIALPATLVSDTPHLREKTAKLGSIARACSIFGVSEIILYMDDVRKDVVTDLNLCADILTYLDTPQYLRKRLYGLSPSFSFAGILPPLQAPHHIVPRNISSSRLGDMRVGIVSSRRSGRVEVDVGLERPVVCQGDPPIGTRLTVKLTGLDGALTGEIVEEAKIHIYWGYRVRRAKSKLSGVIEREQCELKIGTSRYGTKVQEVWSEISKSLGSVRSVLIVFGSPKLGLKEILGQDGVSPETAFDFFINTVPEQKTATVRTEEAVMVTLGLLNTMK